MNADTEINGVTTVYLMRHGRTAHNVSDRLRGRNDLELDETGRTQAEALGTLFAEVSLSRVLSSPLQRAVHTAEPVARAVGLQVEPVEGLNDRDYGEWTGVERSEVIDRYGSVEAAPGVETWEALGERVTRAFDELLAESVGGAIAIVGHDASNRALLANLAPALAITPEDIPQSNGCWNCLQRDVGGWTVTVLDAIPGDGRYP
ncbi:histidine phosphatase family protein [Salinisphaera hydrothermalis]|uniref:histidine phosphatase family protein n=1 Tax=Salinisphaera hydrothermalis TaxID=563188 RepID=UPI00333E6A89